MPFAFISQGPFTPEQWSHLLNIPVDWIRDGAIIHLGLGYGGQKVEFYRVTEARSVSHLSPLR